MPWSNNSGGPWGGGGSSGGGGGGNNPWGSGPPGGGRGPGGGGGGGGGGQQPPDLDELFRQGQERFRRAMTGGGGGGGGAPLPKKAIAGIAAILLAGAWVLSSVFQVETNEKAIVLTLGEYSPPPRGPGLNLAFWPIQTHETLQVTDERSVDVGVSEVRTSRGGIRRDEGLMLTGDENVVDVNFQIVWNISDPASYLFKLALPEQTIEAVSEASIREVIGRSEIQPALNRDAVITDQVGSLIQETLDGYESGVNIVRVNFVSVAPPDVVVEAFDDVTKATQEQDALEDQADGYSRQKLADARGESAQILENAAAYTARVVKDAEGEAARFKAIQEEYAKAPEVTRQRLYLETMERVLGGIDKIILDPSVGGGGEGGGSGIVPYLPLNEIGKRGNP